ncbi:hypothetical protein HMPREF3156_02302 [Neisseria sp. HMSC06F02]|nr:hypothetical protein HMPREF3156_02302 [Neisseria sp. HMSC06F02]
MKAKRHDDFTLGKPIPISINCPLYSGLNLDQDKARQRCTDLKLIHYKQTGTNL